MWWIITGVLGLGLLTATAIGFFMWVTNVATH